MDELDEMGIDEVVPRPVPVPGVGLVCADGVFELNVFLIELEEGCPPEAFTVYCDGRIVGYSSYLLPESEWRELNASELNAPLPLQQWLLTLAMHLGRDLEVEHREKPTIQVRVEGDHLEETYTRFFRRITSVIAPTGH